MEVDQYLSPTLLSSAVVLLLSWWAVRTWQNNRKLPPGPWGFPILGSFPFVKATHEDYSRLAKIYGDVFSFRSVGGILFVVLNGAKTIKEILVNRADEFDGRPKESNLVGWISDELGVAQEEGESWSEHRRFFQQTVRNFGVGKKVIEERIQDEIQSMLQELKKAGPSADLHFHVGYVNNSVISHVLFSKKLDRDQTFKKILTVMSDFVTEFLGKMHIINGLAFDLAMVVFPFMRRLKRGRDGVREFTDKIVEEQIRTFEPSHLRGYVDAYLQQRNELEKKGLLEQSTFDKKRLEAISMNMFFEGTESTTSSIMGLLRVISKHPEEQKKVQQELDNVVGRERLPAWGDRPNLPYTDATIQELFRVESLFLITTHYSNFKETTIGKYRIPKRTTIIANLGSIHFDPKEFPNPQKFDPKRFLNEEGKRIKKEGPYPFGVGKRSCVGEALAQMEVFLVVASILQNFTLRSDGDKVKVFPREN